MRIKFFFVFGIYILPFRSYAAENLQQLAAEFFAWLAVTQPTTSDNINRVERPDGWTPDFSESAIDNS